MSNRFVVVGGDAAGMSAASKAKRDAPGMDVIVFERGQWVSYGACGLPYHIMGKIENLEDLVAITPDEFVEQRDIDLRLHHEVTRVDPERSRVEYRNDGGTRTQSYDDLLIATGARAVEPPVEGLNDPGVFSLHDMEQGRALKRFVETENPGVAALVGGGYIGLEMAEALDAHGIDLHLFEMLPHVLEPFGEPVAKQVEEHLEQKGIELHVNTAVDRINGDEEGVQSVRAGELEVPVDLVVVGAGVRPNVELAEQAGVKLGPTGAIATDEFGATNFDRVYAAGDCAEERNAITGLADYVPLALTANRQGRAIGRTVAGRPKRVGDVVGTALVKVFELEVARTGIIDEETAREAGFGWCETVITAESRAHYYPGGSPIHVHMTADRDSGRLLGASMVGREGVAQRIDVVATALHAGMGLEQLENLDLSYAPPFSPVWDPVLTAAKVLNGKCD